MGGARSSGATSRRGRIVGALSTIAHAARRRAHAARTRLAAPCPTPPLPAPSSSSRRHQQKSRRRTARRGSSVGSPTASARQAAPPGCRPLVSVFPSPVNPPLDNSAGGRRPRRSGRRSSGSPDPAPPIVRPPGRRHTRKIAATGGVRYKRRRPRGNWTGSGTPHAVVAAPCIARVRRSPSRGARTAGRRSPTTGRPAARAAPRRSSPGEWRGRGPRNTGPNCQFATTVAWPRRKAGE